MKKVTAIIPTYNEADRISNAIESVHWADEIMIIDSFSTDQTLEIAAEYPVIILEHEYIGPADQKNWAIPKASHEWIFILDADEEVSPALESEIKAILSQKEIEESAFWIPRVNYYMGKKVRYSGWQNDGVVRLFKRDECRYAQKRVHEEIETNGKTGKLSEPLLHFTYKNLGELLKKVDRYSTWKAKDKVEKGERSGLISMITKPTFTFVKSYFIRFGILDGKVGFIICVISSWSVFLRQLKIWRIREGEKLEN